MEGESSGVCFITHTIDRRKEERKIMKMRLRKENGIKAYLAHPVVESVSSLQIRKVWRN